MHFVFVCFFPHSYVVRHRNADLKSARDLIALIDERVVEMVHTKDGAFVAWIAISLGTAKVTPPIIVSKIEHRSLITYTPLL